MTRNRSLDSLCSIARALGVVGDTWSLLLLRELFKGNDRFDGLQAASGAASNIVAARLRHLQEQGLVTKDAYQRAPVRYAYQLTDKGRATFPILAALMAWGDDWLPGPEGPRVLMRHTGCGRITRPGTHCSECGEALGLGQFTYERSSRRTARAHAKENGAGGRPPNL